MKTCINCKNAETEKGMDCPRCDTLLTLATMVNGKWRPEELQDLAETLRGAIIRDLRKQRAGAILLQNLLSTCQRLCTVRNLDADAMRVSLATRIEKQLAHIIKVKEHDSTRGEGAYRADLNQGMTDLFNDLYAKMHGKLKRQTIPEGILEPTP